MVTFVFLVIRGPCFQYDRSPEIQAVKEAFPHIRSSNNLKEWDAGASPADHELWSLKDLDDFDHGLLRHLLETQLSCSPPATFEPNASLIDRPWEESGRKRSSIEPMTPPQLRKRAKLDAPSLRSFLPAVSATISIICSFSLTVVVRI